VLIVGSGQSGCQIAQELNESGRKIYLCVGNARRLPRRSRGHDSVWWLNELGRFDQTVTDLDSPKERFAGNAYVSGRDGGIEINLHNFARDGIALLGHLRDIDGAVITLAPDLRESLAKADEQAAKLKSGVDELMSTKGIDADALDGAPEPQDGFESDIVTELDLQAAGVTTLIWATGFDFDFGWVRFPVFDEDGFPIQQQRVTNESGLYFVGLHFLYKRKSGLFLGVGEDARNVAEHIAARS
jgi:putative flavoprotein involved in K+ transport